MSHVDDGTLHAFLDGALPRGEAGTMAVEAHLAVCADCGARLERERAVKERAGEVLKGATPLVTAMPDFDEILARHGSQATQPSPATRAAGRARGPARSPVPLAWAASVVLALGAGWMAHALRDTVDLGPEASVTEAMAPERMAADADGAPVAGTQPTAEDAANKTDAPAVSRQAAAPATGTGAGSADAEPPSAPPPATQRASAPPAVAADAMAAETTARALERERNVVESADIGLLGAAAFSAEAATGMRIWRPVTDSDAETHLGTVPARLDGLETVGTYAGLAGDTALVRMLYRLEDGRMVETIEQSRSGGATAGFSPLFDSQLAQREARLGARPDSARLAMQDVTRLGSTTFRVERPATLIRLRSDLPADSLAALAARIR
jgi:hypothetical protein